MGLERARLVEKYSNLPTSAYRFRENVDDQTLKEFRNGIVFLLAFWSGPSIQAFQFLTATLREMQNPSRTFSC